jgi:hypothetical protein
VPIKHFVTITLICALAACGPRRQPNFYSIDATGTRSQKYSRINEYTSYTPGDLGAQAKISAAYEDAQHTPPPKRPVTILDSSLPEGITATGGSFEIAKDAPYAAVGRYEIGYWLDSAPSDDGIREDLERLAAVTTSDVVVVQTQHVAHADPRVIYMTGILLRNRAASSATPATPPTPAKARATAQLVYQAAAGCLSADQFADEISARLGYSPWVATSTMQLHADIARQGAAYHATIRGPTGDATKELDGPSCKVVTEAAVSAISVRLE